MQHLHCLAMYLYHIPTKFQPHPSTHAPQAAPYLPTGTPGASRHLPHARYAKGTACIECKPVPHNVRKVIAHQACHAGCQTGSDVAANLAPLCQPTPRTNK